MTNRVGSYFNDSTYALGVKGEELYPYLNLNVPLLIVIIYTIIPFNIGMYFCLMHVVSTRNVPENVSK